MAETNLKKSKQGYGYKYTELAQINDYLESKGISYYQIIKSEPFGDVEHPVYQDYIYTIPIIDGKELPERRGCRVIEASLSGKSNPAQEQGSSITYSRRYSLLLAFGLATEDDDAESLTDKRGGKTVPVLDAKQIAKLKADLLKMLNDNQIDPALVCDLYKAKSLDEMEGYKLQNAIDNIEKIKAKAKEEKK